MLTTKEYSNSTTKQSDLYAEHSSIVKTSSVYQPMTKPTFNPATKLITSVLGVTLAIAGFHHGLFEVFQGNTEMDIGIIKAIGPDQLRWVHGTEEAFTIIPNFLITGIFAMALSIFIAIWSVSNIEKQSGPFILLFSFVLLTLAGGGIGHVLFFIPLWAYSTNINGSLRWWKKVLGAKAHKLSLYWSYLMVGSSLFFLMGLELSVFGYFPGITDPSWILTICWSMLLISFIMLNMAFISGFAYDLLNRPPLTKKGEH